MVHQYSECGNIHLVKVAGILHVYGFAQFPVYNDLVGYQLFPRYSFSVGSSYAF